MPPKNIVHSTWSLETLLTYTTTLAFYLHLRSSEKYARRPELLHSHPILSRLLVLKQSLTTLEDLNLASLDSEAHANKDSESMDEDEFLDDTEQLWKFERKEGLDPDELDELLKDAALSLQPSTQSVERPKKKRKTTIAEDGHPVFDTTEPTFAPLKIPSSGAYADSEFADAFGEAASLLSADAADKSARKKSLRFHISKIESTSTRRQVARNKAVGGDDDLPYKERKKEKDARLVKEAKVNLRGQGGEDLDDIDPETFGTTGRPSNDGDGSGSGDSEDGYYGLVKKKTKERKQQKKADYETAISTER